MSETERKFDVGWNTLLPTLVDIDGVASMSPPLELQLQAVYFDTTDFDLARRGVTLRRRTGGDDAGWQVKLPQDSDTRTELSWPLGRATRTVPKAVLGPVRALVRDRRLVPIARISTRRLEHQLHGHDGAVLAHLCDDHVRSERIVNGNEAQEWREWEIELVEGDGSLLDVVEQLLTEAGATPPAAGSKLLRSLGDVVVARPLRVSNKRLARGRTAQLLTAYLHENISALHQHDAGVRADRPSAVHDMRITVRRLRSAIKTYKPLLADDRVGSIGDELRWVGQSLSEARDAQVLHERLRALVAAEPPDLVLGPVMRRIDIELRAEKKSGREKMLQALESERYYRLLDALDALLTSVVFTDDAARPAHKVAPDLLQRDAKRLRQAVKAIAHAETKEAREASLHEARKKAKRLRYAAELTTPVLGKSAKSLGTFAKKVQQALGQHQDTVMSRQRLRDYGARTHLSGENGFTFGRLHAVEEVRAAAAVRDFEEAWHAMPKNLRRKVTSSARQGWTTS